MKYLKKITLVFITTVLILPSCKENNSEKETNKNDKQELIVFHAGSLSVPFKLIAKEFEKENPGVKVLLEADGSRKCARKITDLNKQCDVMASADYTVIDELLIPNFADWNIKFASNEMTIVFNENSRYSKEINANNWYEILLKDDAAFGRSDPNSDPCGYRAVLTSKLAENFYKEEGLSKKILEKDINYIRPKETDLLALLESNTIDYIFLYRSVAQQHGMQYLILPDSVNLKLPELKDYYANVNTKITGKKPGEMITKKGAPMVYGITIPKNAPNPELAKKFVQFVLEKNKGMKIMEENGQPSLIPSKSEIYNKIPESLKKFVKQ
ncbi:MAG: tungstate ABC transporter substrate-binding protein WtpA [Bacteroidales bacterium]|nr:tungstate ABC transporter substrate-binding protein WtpA [Bacteroidales bacterium]